MFVRFGASTVQEFIEKDELPKKAEARVKVFNRRERD